MSKLWTSRSSDFAMSMSKQAAVLVRTLLATFIVFANVSLVISIISSVVISLVESAGHLATHIWHTLNGNSMRALGNRYGTLNSTGQRERAILIEAASIGSERLLSRSKIVVLIKSTSIVRGLVLLLEAASASSLEVLTASRHATTRRHSSFLTALNGLTKLGLTVGELALFTHLTKIVLLEVTAKLSLIFRVKSLRDLVEVSDGRLLYKLRWLLLIGRIRNLLVLRLHLYLLYNY